MGLQRLSFYSSNNYVTLNNLIAREKSGEIFQVPPVAVILVKKKNHFSVWKPTGKIVALTELLRMWENISLPPTLRQ